MDRLLVVTIIINIPIIFQYVESSQSTTRWQKVLVPEADLDSSNKIEVDNVKIIRQLKLFNKYHFLYFVRSWSVGRLRAPDCLSRAAQSIFAFHIVHFKSLT